MYVKTKNATKRKCRVLWILCFFFFFSPQKQKCADIDISIDDVKSYFRHVNPPKASGHDGINIKPLNV